MFPPPKVNVNPRDLMAREASVVGVMGGSPAEIAESFAYINSGLRIGFLNPEVGSTFALDQAPAAHVDVIEHQTGSTGKVILLPWPADSN